MRVNASYIAQNIFLLFRDTTSIVAYPHMFQAKLQWFEQTCLPLWSMGVESTEHFSRPGVNLWQEVKLTQATPKLSHWNGDATRPLEWEQLFRHSVLKGFEYCMCVTKNVSLLSTLSCPVHPSLTGCASWFLVISFACACSAPSCSAVQC